MTNFLIHNPRPYREATQDELREYAIANVLDLFKNPYRNSNISDFFLAQLRITNWNKFFQSFLQEEYIQNATVEETLSTYTVADLKIIADSLSVKKTGKKAEIIKTISEAMSPEEAENFRAKHNMFILTEKGKRRLDDIKDLAMLRAHSVYCVSVAEFYDMRTIGTIHRNFYDTMYHVLCDRLRYYEIRKDYMRARIEHLHIFEILMEEHKKTMHNVPLEIPLEHYIKFLYLDTCILDVVEYIASGYNYDPASRGGFISEVPPTVYQLADYRDRINYHAIASNYPPSFLTEDEFVALVNEIFDTSMFDYQKWNNLLKQRLSEFSAYIKSTPRR